jgi:hypothetical protein
MKARILYDQFASPPLLTMYITGCPHKRQQREVIQRFREDLFISARRQLPEGLLPIDHEIDLNLTLINPASPDLDHLLEAVYMGIDGKSMVGPSILTDDRLIQKITMQKMYNQAPTKRDGMR